MYAASMARRPWFHLAVAFVVGVVLSFIGLHFGNFEVSVDNAGWWSRGTLIANRAAQEMLVNRNCWKLFFDATGEVWDELQDEVQPNWQGRQNDEASDGAAEKADNAMLEAVCSGKWYGSPDMAKGWEGNLVSVWKTEDDQKSALDADTMHELCTAEENTLRALQDGDSCYKCGAAGRCIEPYSLVLMAWLHLTNDDVFQWGGNSSTLAERFSCDDLRSSWMPSVQRQFTIALKNCVNWSVWMASSDGRDNTIIFQGTTINITNPCPLPVRFLPTMVDESFPDDSVVRYSSSYYATKRGRDDARAMYEGNEKDAYNRSDGAPMSRVYDTTDESFGRFYAEIVVGRDMSLAVGSAGVTVVDMIAHTRSPFLTLMGLFQILLSFPLAYFVYHFVAGLIFFPFLNFIGIFVVFALGADDVFVAVDKWKNARHELPHGTTKQVAALALPDAAYAMLLTWGTMAVAFFGTAICPVGPIVCFAVFCGLLITLDYVMNILSVFPTLCLYDRWLLAGSKNYFVSFDWCCCGNDKGEDWRVSGRGHRPGRQKQV